MNILQVYSVEQRQAWSGVRSTLAVQVVAFHAALLPYEIKNLNRAWRRAEAWMVRPSMDSAMGTSVSLRLPSSHYALEQARYPREDRGGKSLQRLEARVLQRRDIRSLGKASRLLPKMKIISKTPKRISLQRLHNLLQV